MALVIDRSDALRALCWYASGQVVARKHGVQVVLGETRKLVGHSSVPCRMERIFLSPLVERGGRERMMPNTANKQVVTGDVLNIYARHESTPGKAPCACPSLHQTVGRVLPNKIFINCSL